MVRLRRQEPDDRITEEEWLADARRRLFQPEEWRAEMRERYGPPDVSRFEHLRQIREVTE